MATEAKQCFELIAQKEQSALSLLQDTGLSVERLKYAAQQGSVWVQSARGKAKRLRRIKKSLQQGDKLWLYYDPDILDSEVTDATLIIDKTDYSIWFKPRGMFSQPSKWSDTNSISRNVELQLSRPTYLVHRLDRMTAGLIILAHKRSFVETFTSAFSTGEVRKIYRAVIKGRGIDKPMEVNEPLDGKPAHSIIRSLRFDGQSGQSLLEVEIKSGKKHQIRRHLAFLNCPIVGDRLYGDPDDQEDLQLLATELTFQCPVTNESMHIQLDKQILNESLLLGTNP